MHRINYGSKWLLVAAPLIIFSGLVQPQSQGREYKPQPLTQKAKQGRQAFAGNSCRNCHSIRGEGGCLAPVLDGIGAHRSEDFIVRRISSSPADRKKFYGTFQGTELMEHVKVKPQEARTIAAYLLTLPQPKTLTATGHDPSVEDPDSTPAGSAFKPLTPSGSTKSGAILYQKHACSACHSIGWLGGRLAPPLDGVGARRSRNFIQGRMRHGAMEIVIEPEIGHTSRITMPPQRLTEQEISQITDYLMTLPPLKMPLAVSE